MNNNVILVDADYVDKVAFNLIVNFERMIGRRIPQADFAKWIDCVALDGGIREGEQETQVILLHGKQKKAMDKKVTSKKMMKMKKAKNLKTLKIYKVVNWILVRGKTKKRTLKVKVKKMKALMQQVAKVSELNQKKEKNIQVKAKKNWVNLMKMMAKMKAFLQKGK